MCPSGLTGWVSLRKIFFPTYPSNKLTQTVVELQQKIQLILVAVCVSTILHHSPIAKAGWNGCISLIQFLQIKMKKG